MASTRGRFLLPVGATFVGAAATDVFLEGVERGDMFGRFADNRRWPGGGKLVEVTPDRGQKHGGPGQAVGPA